MDTINRLEKEILVLRETLQLKEKELSVIKSELAPINSSIKEMKNVEQNSIKSDTSVMIGEKLPKWAIERYSRQILLPDIGVKGQEKLMNAKVLIVGAGGLGCPSSVYLAGAGVGEIGIVDYDTVDVTNIHRQILHGESDQNISKVESAANSLRSINSTIKVVPYNMELTPSNALQLAAKYDIILDCTDNVPTRYMLNDVSVLNKMPLISGSALKMEGQLTVYGYRAERNPNEKDSTYTGPCYRCVFPTPPPAAAVGSCSADGVAGPVPGAIGTLQALEAIKLIVGKTHDSLLVGRMLLFDGEDMSFRNVKLRGRNPECDICSENPKITKLLDYEVVCRMQSKEKDLNLHILPPKNRISATQLADALRLTNKHLLVDVRSESEFDMCKLDGAVNYPLEKLHRNSLDELLKEIRDCCHQGTLQALEAIKLIVGKTHESLLVGRMLLFDGEDMSFRNVKLRGRNPECDICSENPKITKLLDYEVVCRMQSKEKDLNLHILPPKNRISATQLADALRQTNKHLLVDVRSESEFDMCKLDGAVNYPLEKLHRKSLDDLLKEIRDCCHQVTFICRRGNDSQIAAKKVLDLLEDEHKEKITDLTGGLHAWSKYVDGEFPVY